MIYTYYVYNIAYQRNTDQATDNTNRTDQPTNHQTCTRKASQRAVQTLNLCGQQNTRTDNKTPPPLRFQLEELYMVVCYCVLAPEVRLTHKRIVSRCVLLCVVVLGVIGVVAPYFPEHCIAQVALFCQSNNIACTKLLPEMYF